MPYDHATVQTCLATIKSVAPEIELVRTEIFPVGGSLPWQQFTLVRANGRMDLKVPQTLEVSAADEQRLHGFLGIDAARQEVLIRQLSTLHSLNHYGAWVVSPAPAPALLVGGESRSLLGDGDSLLTRVHDSLFEALPGVHEIRVEACVNVVSSGGMRRRPCIRVMATAALELAAIDATLFPAHLQALLLPRGFAKAHHHRRAAAWASQLAVDVDLMARIMDDLGLLVVSLPVTRIVLRPAMQTSLYWKVRGPRHPSGGKAGRNEN